MAELLDSDGYGFVDVPVPTAPIEEKNDEQFRPFGV